MIKVDGVSATLRAGKKRRLNDGEAVAIGLAVCAKTLYNKSQEYVPVDKGDLKASGKVTVVGKGMATRATVEYNAPHAVVVHEVLSNYHEPPTRARYLADAVHASRGTMTARLKRELYARMKI